MFLYIRGLFSLHFTGWLLLVSQYNVVTSLMLLSRTNARTHTRTDGRHKNTTPLAPPNGGGGTKLGK